MMKLSLFVRFFLSAIIALPITFLGLKLYFSDARIADALTVQYSGAQFNILSGQAKEENNSLVVNQVDAQKGSFVNISNLLIDSRFYNHLVIRFDEKESSQPLVMRLQNNADDMPKAYPILYTNQLISRFEIDKITPPNTVINSVGLFTDKLISAYRIASLTFEPKHFDNQLFAVLLWDSLGVHQTAREYSSTTTQSTKKTLMPAKLLVTIYVLVVGLLLCGLTFLTKQSFRAIWWVLLIFAWGILDIRYMVEKTATIKRSDKNTGQSSHINKTLSQVPSTEQLAQHILSVVPERSSPQQIQMSVMLGITDKQKQEITNQLRYYLYPHQLNNKDIPLDVLKQQGYYRVMLFSNTGGNSNKKIKNPPAETKVLLETPSLVIIYREPQNPIKSENK